jgi:hypothetical protein
MFKPPSFKFPKSVAPPQTPTTAAAPNSSETVALTATAANVSSSGDAAAPSPAPQNNQLNQLPVAASAAKDDDEIAEEVEYDEV